jgi:peptidoglycan/xylan/chitin deacetylase (PgdA/CDA1 family)
MPTLARIYGCLCRSFLLLAACLAPGIGIPCAHAFQVADSMALLRQEMPANYCALTFDDGPGPYTAALLDLLAARGIVGAFFVVGHNAERRPALIRRMLADGHEVASHGYSHADLRRLKPEAQFQEMKRSLDVLHALGAEVRYFRPPYGRYTPETVAKAESLGLTIMLWSLDSQDWKRSVSLGGLRSVSPVVQQSFAGMRGVLLFHDTHKRTVDEMADILHALAASGCDRFVTVSEYMAVAPREEGYRLSTQAPNEGRGEIPPPAHAGRLPDPAADGLAPPPEDARGLRMSGAGMRTQAAHPVQAWKSAGMRTQAAHGVPGGPAPAAVPETLMTGIVTDGPPAGVRGRIPRLLSDPGMLLPAHKPSRGKRDMKQGESNPG